MHVYFRAHIKDSLGSKLLAHIDMDKIVLPVLFPVSLFTDRFLCGTKLGNSGELRQKVSPRSH